MKIPIMLQANTQAGTSTLPLHCLHEMGTVFTYACPSRELRYSQLARVLRGIHNSNLETQPSSLHWHKTACLTPIQDLVKARGTRRWQVINKPPDAQTACVVMRLNHHHQMQMKGTLVTHRINQTISFPRVQFLVNPVSDWTNSEN